MPSPKMLHHDPYHWPFIFLVSLTDAYFHLRSVWGTGEVAGPGAFTHACLLPGAPRCGWAGAYLIGSERGLDLTQGNRVAMRGRIRGLVIWVVIQTKIVCVCVCVWSGSFMRACIHVWGWKHCRHIGFHKSRSMLKLMVHFLLLIFHICTFLMFKH